MNPRSDPTFPPRDERNKPWYTISNDILVSLQPLIASAVDFLSAVATERAEPGRLGCLIAGQLVDDLRVVQLGARLLRGLFAGLFNQGRLGLLFLLTSALGLLLLAWARRGGRRHRVDDRGRLGLLFARRLTRARRSRLLLAPAAALGLVRDLVHDGRLGPARAGRLAVARARRGRVRQGGHRRQQGQGEDAQQHCGRSSMKRGSNKQRKDAAALCFFALRLFDEGLPLLFACAQL
jgi:hypothetical protein